MGFTPGELRHNPGLCLSDFPLAAMKNLHYCPTNAGLKIKLYEAL